MRAQHHPPPCLFVLDYLTDLSAVNVQLFNFHAARASVCGCDTVHDPSESRGAALSNIICWSWNHGQCVAPFASCRFAHKCSSFFGQHRVGDYPGDLSSKLSTGSKHPPASPPRSRSKSRQSGTLCFGYVTVTLRAEECRCCIDIFLFTLAYV